MGWITWIITWVTASFMSTKWYLRNRKHFLCFHTVIETQVEVWENKKFPYYFEFSQTFTTVSVMFWNTGKNVFCFFYKITHDRIFIRPFRLTCVIARARTRVNLSAHAICCTHEKSYSAEKVLFHKIFFFQSFVYIYECHLWIMRYMSIAYCRCWLWRPEGCMKWKVGFVGFRVGFRFVCFLEPPKPILYIYYFKC